MVSKGGVIMCQRLQRTHRWTKSCRGRSRGKRTGGGGCSHHPQHRHRYTHKLQYRHRPGGGTGGVRATPSLRPINMKGNRVRGMRAPKNTNQFLMHEKYQLLHMRSDSVGSDSGSDSDLELTDMDSYLGVLENARGALLDCPSPPSAPGHMARRQKHLRLHEDSLHLQDSLGLQEGSLHLQEDTLHLQEDTLHLEDSLRLQEDSLHLQEDTLHLEDSLRLQEDSLHQEDSLRLQEDSLQYFPSEDDLIQSQNFMQRDFVEFCDFLTT